jgi:hypothetical protein
MNQLGLMALLIARVLAALDNALYCCSTPEQTCEHNPMKTDLVCRKLMFPAFLPRDWRRQSRDIGSCIICRRIRRALRKPVFVEEVSPSA